MNRLVARVGGFAIPTLAVITVAHVARQMSWGEGIDGVVSGAWFTLPFALVGWLRSRLEGHRKSALARTSVHEFALGLMAGLVTWLAIWLGWQLPSVTGWRPHAFAINSAVTGLAGLLLPPAGRVVTERVDSGETTPLNESAP